MGINKGVTELSVLGGIFLLLCFISYEGGKDQYSHPSLPVLRATAAKLVMSNTRTDGLLPLVTLVTTFKNTTSHSINIVKNTILNRAELMPRVQPVLYTTQYDHPFAKQYAQKYGWKAFPVPRTNEYGTPFYKDILSDIQHRVQSQFYGFANGDNLYNEGLVKTLECVAKNKNKLGTTLIIGRRTNVDVSATDRTNFYSFNDVTLKAEVSGNLFLYAALDYHIFAPLESFPWHKVKDVVVGRIRMDNYLVIVALENNVTVIDATKTLLALHQSTDGDNFASFRAADAKYNINVIKDKLNFNKGSTRSAHYETGEDSKGNVILIKRTS